MQVIQGEEIAILLDSKRAFHATAHSLQIDLELKEIRTKDTNGKENYPGDISWSGSADGLIVLDEDYPSSSPAKLTTGEMLDIVLAKKKVAVSLNAEINGVFGTYTGYAYISSMSLSTPAGDNATYSISLTGNGTLTKSSQ